MKEFSKELEPEKSFEIGGQVLQWRYPYWEELAAIFDEDLASVRNGQEVGDTTTKEALEQTIERIGLFLDNGSQEKWAEVAHRREDPVPLWVITDLYRWLLEVTSGRPTQPPSDSEPGGGETEASSPDA